MLAPAHYKADVGRDLLLVAFGRLAGDRHARPIQAPVMEPAPVPLCRIRTDDDEDLFLRVELPEHGRTEALAGKRSMSVAELFEMVGQAVAKHPSKFTLVLDEEPLSLHERERGQRPFLNKKPNKNPIWLKLLQHKDVVQPLFPKALKPSTHDANQDGNLTDHASAPNLKAQVGQFRSAQELSIQVLMLNGDSAEVSGKQSMSVVELFETVGQAVAKHPSKFDLILDTEKLSLHEEDLGCKPFLAHEPSGKPICLTLLWRSLPRLNFCRVSS